MTITIIIINYKCKDYLEDCLKCIPKKYSITIVDNQNEAKLLNKLKKKYNINIIPFTKNLGFAKANNIAIKQARTKYILTLNADCFLNENYIKNCMNFLKKNKEYGSIQGKLLLKNKPTHIDSTGNFLANTGFAHSLNHNQPDNNPKSEQIFGTCAAAAIYKKEALEKINTNNEYFDNDFFAYLEDIDLDWRLNNVGYKAYFNNQATAYHIRSPTTNNKFRIKQALKNRLYMIIKNDTIPSLLFNLIFYTPLLLITNPKSLSLIPKMLKKRKLINYKHQKQTKLLISKTPIKKYFNVLKLFQ